MLESKCSLVVNSYEGEVYLINHPFNYEFDVIPIGGQSINHVNAGKGTPMIVMPKEV